MFATNYYTLVAGLRDYALDADTKGFDAAEIRSEILTELSSADARQVRLLSAYYDCENLAALRAGRSAYNPLGNLSAEELEEELKAPKRLPEPLREVIAAYAATGEDEEEGEPAIDTAQPFERTLFTAYYDLCAKQGCAFLKAWSSFDRTLRNVAAAVTARTLGRTIEEVTIGRDEIVEHLNRSSAADFGLRGELPWLDAVINAVNDEANLVEKEHKIDLIRWNESVELSVFDYFDIDAILAYLVRVQIVARWSRLDAARGRQLFERLLRELDSKELIHGNK